MALPGITQSNGESVAFIPEIWLGTALGYLRNYITLGRTVTMDTDLPTGETFNIGKTLHLPKRGILAVNNKTEQNIYQVQNPQSSTVDLTLNQQPEVTIALTSQVLAMQNQPQQAGYMMDAVAKIAEYVDLALFGIYRTVAAANTITNAGTITEANILSARMILRNNKIAPNVKAYGVVSTTEEAAILQLPNLVRYDATGERDNVANAKVGDGQASMPGAIGKAYQFEIAPTQLVPQQAGNDNTIQTLTITGTPTGGTFTPTAGALPVSYNAPASGPASSGSVQYSLGTVFGAGNVYVSGAFPNYTVALLQNVAALTPTGAFTGGASPAIAAAQATQTTGAKNLFYTQDAILMATRALPLPPPGTGALGTVMTDPMTGITMRLVTSWRADYGCEVMSLDMLFGFAPMRGEHMVLVQTQGG